MGVNVNRATNQLGRTAPTEDAVICYLLTGVAVADKIALSDPKQIFGTDALETYGIIAGTNPLAFKEITDFYSKAGEGAEMNFMLVSDATSLATMCDKANNLAKKLLDSTEGRGVILMVNKIVPEDYEVVVLHGFDTDVWNAVAKMNELAVAYATENIPFVGALPGNGFLTANIGGIPARSTQTTENVAISCYCEKSDGIVSMGILGGWLVKHQVHQNIARVLSGKVTDTAFFPDGTTWLSLKSSIATLAGKGLIVPQKHGRRSGYFFFDDPTLTPVTDDYSSISWNRVMNKVQRIGYDVLVDKLNDDIDVDVNTGKMEPTLASDWESDVENEIRAQMMKSTGNIKKEISGVKCTVDPDSDIVNDEVDATISIVRKGQAKTINVTIRYVRTIEE